MANVAMLSTIADQTASQLAGAASALMPSGTVLTFAGASAPSGWLLCDGSAVSRTTYSALFAAIGTTYGTGDGSTTFNLPDCRGIFIAGSGSQTVGGITYTRTHGAKQGDAMQGHKHSNDNFWEGSGAAGSLNTIASFPIINKAGEYGRAVSSPITDAVNGTPRTGAETRPANIAMNHIIKV